jgi:hypothetical protein
MGLTIGIDVVSSDTSNLIRYPVEAFWRGNCGTQY